MEWQNIRGTAIKKIPRYEHRYIEKKIIFIINKQLDKFTEKYKITNINKYGSWVII